jgi:prephenate dehydratase
MIVAYQGESGAFSEQAAREFFGARAILRPLPAFSDVFADVERHPTGFGIVPIENSLFGSIHQVYDLLLKHKLFITGKTPHRITCNGSAQNEVERHTHNLLAIAGDRSVRKLSGHAQKCQSRSRA